MNDELNTLISEIEESTDNDESVASGGDTKPTSGEDDLDVEAVFKSSSETPKKSAKELTEDLKANAWVRKIQNGKASIDDLATSSSDHFLLEKVVNSLEKISEREEDIKKYEQYENSKQFKQDMETLRSLPIEAKRKIVEVSKEYIELGVSQEKALRKALTKSQGFIEEMETARKQRVEAGQLPTGRSSGGQVVYTAEQIAKMSQSEATKVFQMEKRGEVVIKL